MAEVAGSPLEDALARLPATFSHGEARAAGVSDRHPYALGDAGLLESLGRMVPSLPVRQ